jgi:hypothetical protein
MTSLDAMLDKLRGVDDAAKAKLHEEMVERFKDDIWIANAGPQLQAFTGGRAAAVRLISSGGWR